MRPFILSRLTHNVISFALIISFRDKEASRILQRKLSHKLPENIQRVALRKLRMLANARQLGDLRSPPANRLEKLRGDRAEQYSIRINDRWRICFVWRDRNAHEVEIVDYH